MAPMGSQGEPTIPTASDLVADGMLGVPQASEFLGIGRSTLYALMESGDLQYVKLGGRRLVPKRALVELAARNLVRST